MQGSKNSGAWVQDPRRCSCPTPGALEMLLVLLWASSLLCSSAQAQGSCIYVQAGGVCLFPSTLLSGSGLGLQGQGGLGGLSKALCIYKYQSIGRQPLPRSSPGAGNVYK